MSSSGCRIASFYSPLNPASQELHRCSLTCSFHWCFGLPTSPPLLPMTFMTQVTLPPCPGKACTGLSWSFCFLPRPSGRPGTSCPLYIHIFQKCILRISVQSHLSCFWTCISSTQNILSSPSLLIAMLSMKIQLRCLFLHVAFQDFLNPKQCLFLL